MGKDFTSAKGDDNVYTPYSMTEQLLENEKFDYNKTVFEPACGNGAILHVINDHFDYVGYGDIRFNDSEDFLEEKYETYNYIITNPPYSKLNQFILKAKQIATEKFAFLCKITHLGGVERFESELFRDPEYPLTKIYMFTRQANLRFCSSYPELCEDGKYPAGMYYYVWLVWEKANKCYERQFLDLIPKFGWINNDKYILRKSDNLQ